MDIPWKTDALCKVPNNQICKAIAQKVSIRNEKLDSKYLDVFKEQEQLGIIEEIPAGFDHSDHKFIPHRSRIRSDPLVNHTKIIPVFNCSFKSYGNLSLNDANFPRVDLLNDMLGLLNHFRSNKYVLLADIAKTFLQIRLNRKVIEIASVFASFLMGNINYLGTIVSYLNLSRPHLF